MLNLQLLGTLPFNINQTASVLGLWLFPKTSSLKKTTQIEKKWAERLYEQRKMEYLFSRGQIRHVLSTVFKMDALQVPLIAPPGKPTLLPQGWGYLNISHCKDALLIGWSNNKIGVDIERLDRILNVKDISHRILHIEEKKKLNTSKIKLSNEDLLTRWVAKEAVVKWQRGSIFKDIKNWEINIEKGEAKNKQLGLRSHLIMQQIFSWKIGVALDEEAQIKNPIICMS